MAEKNSRTRLSITILLFLGLYLLVVFKLFYWQIVMAESLKQAQVNQSSDQLTLSAIRGDILASDRFPLATNKISYLLYANPKVVDDKDNYAKLLAPILDVDEASISAQLSKNLFWVRLAQKLPDDKKQQVEKLNLSGLGFEVQTDRFYPEASMAAQLVGFLGKDTQGNDHGYFGLEGYYNGQLAGRNGRLYVVKDALGNPVVNDIREEKKIDGRTLVLGVDRTMQYIADKRIREGVTKYEAEGGSIIIMDSKTGMLLASSSVPNFDPQHYYDFDGGSFKNPIISNLYEPGSTFKVLVMSAALDLKKVTPTTRCTICSGPVPVDGYNIETWDNKYFPNETMTEVIQHSDNTGMVFVGRQLGKDNLLSYIRNFGIGEPTGVDLQGEGTGTLRDTWSDVDLATATFGQGISVTPLQLITAVNAIADGGNLMKPYVVKQIITEDGRKIDVQPTLEHRVIKESTAKLMTWIMVNAVEKGEAKWTKLPHYSIAGKTGTAQIPVAGHYDPKETIASFVGFFPADDPKITMLVLVHRPKTSIYGAETAAPIFFAVAKDIINYLGIPPSY
ncbi:MAG: peptidoglycan D,D-transpeptidase FtsI family protein [Candidatus Levyibacteriota bacterium]